MAHTDGQSAGTGPATAPVGAAGSSPTPVPVGGGPTPAPAAGGSPTSALAAGGAPTPAQAAGGTPGTATTAQVEQYMRQLREITDHVQAAHHLLMTMPLTLRQAASIHAAASAPAVNDGGTATASAANDGGAALAPAANDAGVATGGTSTMPVARAAAAGRTSASSSGMPMNYEAAPVPPPPPIQIPADVTAIVPAAGAAASDGRCYYERSHTLWYFMLQPAPSASQLSGQYWVKMAGRTASPKFRFVCEQCWHKLKSEGHIE
jgi:hypothetical protein